MDINKICPGCMREVENKEQTNNCPHCGYDLKNPKSAQHQLQPYTILRGKYLIGRVIGEGGFGITYLGFDLTLEIPVAIKEFYPNGFVTREANVTSKVTIYAGNNAADIEKWRNNFIKEARSLAKFTNLNGIVKVQEFFNENETAYIVMEYVDGITVKSYLKQNGGKLPVPQVLQMMEPVIQSLAKVHETGIIHRDISPDNIMITSDGGMKLLDFGAARDVSGTAEKSLSVMLKPGYAPEEQYRTRGNQGSWSDVYALCATIYKCITGITPVESMERMRSDSLKRPSELGIAIEPYQEEALMAGMAVYAEQRIQNMSMLHDALYGGRVGQPVMSVQAPLQRDDSLTVPLTGAQTQYGTQPQYTGQTQYGAQPQYTGQTQYGAQPQYTGQTQYGAQPQYTGQAQYGAQPENKGGLSTGAKAAIGGIIAAGVVLILVIVGVSAGSSKKTADAKVQGQQTVAQAEEKTQEMDASDEKIQYLTDMLRNKDYENLINEILYGDLSELEDRQDEVNEILRQAIEGHQNQCLEKVEEAMANNELIGIYEVINAEIVYRQSLIEAGVQEELVPMDKINAKADEVMPYYKECVYAKALAYAKDADEDGWNELFEEADRNISGDDYTYKRAALYGKFVATKSLMIDSSEGSRAAMDYINRNLDETYNNCYCMELWDVYDHKQGGGAYEVSMPHAVKNGYLLEDSDNRYISQNELAYLTRYEVHLALFEIYARHGRIFTDPQVNEFFAWHSWYTGQVEAADFDETCLNDCERENISMIVNYKKSKGWFGY